MPGYLARGKEERILFLVEGNELGYLVRGNGPPRTSFNQNWDVTLTGPEEAKALIEGEGAIILEHRKLMYENELKDCLGAGQSYDSPDSWKAFINPE